MASKDTEKQQDPSSAPDPDEDDLDDLDGRVLCLKVRARADEQDRHVG